MEKKTARGSKLIAAVSGSPRTPKTRKQGVPLSKMRKLESSPITQAGPSEEPGYIPDPTAAALPFKKKTGKVCFAILVTIAAG